VTCLTERRTRFALAAPLLAALASACGGSSTPTPAPTPTPTFTFAITDDSRAQGGAAAVSNGASVAVISAIAHDIAAARPDMVFFPGDMVTGEVNDAGQLSSELDTWAAAFAAVADAGIPLYTTRGNHEYNPGTNGAVNPIDPSLAPYKAHFPLPTAQATLATPTGAENDLSWSFTYKNVKFIGFDNYANRTSTYDNTLYAPGSNSGQAMSSWVLNEVNSSTAGLVFATSHEMLWPSASHPDCLANDPDSRDALVKALAAHNGVYFSGHDHMLLRGTVANGNAKVPVMVVGTGGGGNYAYGPPDPTVYTGYTGATTFTDTGHIDNSVNPVFGWVLVTVYSDNTWTASFRGFRFNAWGSATDASFTPITVVDTFKSSDF
jgi:Calcineurin-like phosphoesterase